MGGPFAHYRRLAITLALGKNEGRNPKNSYHNFRRPNRDRRRVGGREPRLQDKPFFLLRTRTFIHNAHQPSIGRKSKIAE
jgi:hypothetical protein